MQENSIMPLQDKVQTTNHIAVPTNNEQLRSFIGVINYNRDLWKLRSDILAPLAKMTSKQATWIWTEEHQKAFEHMNKSISRDTVYPNFSELFVNHMDASNIQLGSVISQHTKPKCSRKLNPSQVIYTTTEKELLSIVETLKELRNICLG